MKIIDISAYQGKIDWSKVAKEVNHVILRSTTQNGKIDTRYMENFNGCVKNSIEIIDVYKFAYTRKYVPAYIEASKTLQTLAYNGTLNFINTFWLDLEKFGTSDFTTEEANEVIKGYQDAAEQFNARLGLYFNYNYAKNIVDSYWSTLPLWLARYNKTMGDVYPFKPVLWQYTSSGTVDGINGNVDISKEV